MLSRVVWRKYCWVLKKILPAGFCLRSNRRMTFGCHHGYVFPANCSSVGDSESSMMSANFSYEIVAQFVSVLISDPQIGCFMDALREQLQPPKG